MSHTLFDHAWPSIEEVQSLGKRKTVIIETIEQTQEQQGSAKERADRTESHCQLVV
jgi:hypothetical protein